MPSVLAADDGQGLYKLQLIKEAKRACPDVVIVLGEDLTRFRNASKDLYAFLNAFSWNQKVERLGFDEVGLSVIITFFSLSCRLRHCYPFQPRHSIFISQQLALPYAYAEKRVARSSWMCQTLSITMSAC